MPNEMDLLKIFSDQFGAACATSFASALFVIVVSELGDRTFFLAAIYSMKYSRLHVFLGAMFANFWTTFISAILGGYATTILPQWVTQYISAILFIIFAPKAFYEAYHMDADECEEEYESVKKELDQTDKHSANSPSDEKNVNKKYWNKLVSLFPAIFIQLFILTFISEWGDRSQLSMMLLSAAHQDLVGVIVGGVIGHALCTGLAVLAGRSVAQKLSQRTVQIIGGVFFIMSAFHILYFEEHQI